MSEEALKSLTWKTIPQGAATHIVAAFDPSIVNQSGSYLEDAKVSNETARPYALDDSNAQQLWKLSEDLVKYPELVA
ncbi:hypothetical protein K493DRAFT_66822 [Basidiobolus meristosporus CBS 931.73]|nr:hypothetical protein K493DRAFT_66822 [Basidiobolus meristosporus CBS 931.73]|eukprot:ORX89634.1 hypothetical protein K493DRAFT_66822 [Basidiobolus meristosporus CBS 931.73]